MKHILLCLVFIGCLFSCEVRTQKSQVTKAEVPNEFGVKVTGEEVGDSVMNWALVTAKRDALDLLNADFPKAQIKPKARWLLEPKEIFYSDAADEARWFFIFQSNEGYFVQMVVDEFKQVSDLEVGQRQAK